MTNITQLWSFMDQFIVFWPTTLLFWLSRICSKQLFPVKNIWKTIQRPQHQTTEGTSLRLTAEHNGAFSTLRERYFTQEWITVFIFSNCVSFVKILLSSVKSNCLHIHKRFTGNNTGIYFSVTLSQLSEHLTDRSRSLSVNWEFTSVSEMC